MATIKRLKTEETSVVDPFTGEVKITTTENHYRVFTESTDEFFMVYYNMLSAFYNLTRISDVVVLMRLCTMAEFNTGVINLSTSLRAELCEILKIKPSNLSASLKRLVDTGLIDGGRGKYRINPEIFWKGDIKHRKDAVKVTFEF